MIYEVWSHHRGAEEEETGHDVLEFRRTDREAAREDMRIIQSILSRKAWIVESDV